MKVRVDRDVFADAVAWTARSLPSRPTLPILAGLLLDVGADELTLSGFDYEVSARATVAVRGDEPGTVLVSGRLLSEITRSLPGQPVDIVTDGARVVVTCGAARFALPTLPVEDYPSLPAMPHAAGTVGGDAFAAAVTSVAVAAGRDDTLPFLTGMRMEFEDELVTLAATDRYRLAVRELRWDPTGPGSSAVALVPARTLAETAKAFAAGGEVTIALSSGTAGEGMMGFEALGRRTTTRLLDSEFPKYRSLIPSTFAATAEIPTPAFAEALRRVSLVVARTSPVRLSFATDEVLLEAGGGDEAQASEALPAEFTGDPFTIAFNPGY
ncbi:MAG TPA: DNA polymerase III subunit beta, partial [Mycobacteriales bacterium]|nr:DNA polymerase III subunit beta [Mycobacteriales bacterium]